MLLRRVLPGLGTPVSCAHGRRVLQRLRQPGAAAHPRRREAESRLWAARQLLRQGAQQRRVRDGLVDAGLRPVTRRVRCAVDARALREYVQSAGPAADTKPPPSKSKGGFSFFSRKKA